LGSPITSEKHLRCPVANDWLANTAVAESYGSAPQIRQPALGYDPETAPVTPHPHNLTPLDAA